MIILVEFGVHDGVSERTLYVATDGYTSRPSDTPANQYYMPRLQSVGPFEAHMFSGGDGLSGGAIGGQSEVGAGSVVVANGRPYDGTELIDDWIDLAFRTITIRRVETDKQSLAQATTVFFGSADRLVSTNALEKFEVAIFDRLYDLNVPLLVNQYSGTTVATGMGIEGEADLAGQLKPKIWGTKHNAQCVAVNIYDLLYQVSDGVVSSIVAYDGGLALDNIGDFTDTAALVAASIIPGQYGTCLSVGVFRLGGTAVGAVTADVIEGTSPADRTAAQVVNRILAWVQDMYPGLTVELSSGAMAALDALNSSEVGVAVNGSDTAISVISRVLNSVGGWMLPVATSSSKFDLGRFEAPSGAPVATFDLDDCFGGPPSRVDTGDGRGIPSYRVVVRYDQIGVTQKGDQLFGNVSAGRRAYLLDEWRQASAEDTDLLNQYPKAPTATIDTCLINQTDAQAEAARLLALYSVRRDHYQMTVWMDDATACVIGSVVELVSRDGRMMLGTEAGAGKLFRVIGRRDDYDDVPRVTLDLWG